MRQRQFQSTKPLSPVQIEREMLRTLDLLEIYTNGGTDPDDGEIVTSYERLGRIMADAESDYRLAQARRSVSVAGNSAYKNDFMRKAQVDLATDTERRQHGYAEAVFHARRELLTTLRNTLDALRTMSANVRSLG